MAKNAMQYSSFHPTISVITSCYNRAATIRACMESVLKQTYDGAEYIIVDGASTDESLDIIRSVQHEWTQDAGTTSTDDTATAAATARGKRHITVISEPDGGMYEAINKGIRAATGDVIALVHSDDVLYDDEVLADVAAVFARTDADFVYGDGLYVDATTGRPVRDWRSGRYSRRKVRLGWLPLHTTCFIRRRAMLRLGLYDESYKIAADSDLLVRYLYENTLHVERIRRYIVRMTMGGLSTDKAKRRAMWREDVRMYRSHGFPPVPTKIMKMAWKIPQFVRAALR